MFDKSAWIAILVAFGLACASFTYSLIVLSQQHGEVCRVVRSIAVIEAGKAREEKPRTEQFERESKDRFGLTQERFNQLIEQTNAKQESRATALSVIAGDTCR